MTKPSVVVIYHSVRGHTKKQAEAVAKGSEQFADTTLMSVDDVDWDKLDNADAIIFGAPTFMGSVPYQFKKFMDETGTRWIRQAWRNKIAGGFTNSGSPSGDKLNTLVQLTIFGTSLGMIWVGMDELPTKEINRLGSYLGPMAQSDNAPAEVTPPESDLKTAELYGKRVAAITLKFKAH